MTACCSSGGLGAAGYARWLREQAVAYVALPDAPLDPSSAREGQLIRGGLPYLREVFSSAHWRVFEVLGATPLLGGAGRLVSLGHDSFSVYAYAPGTLTRAPALHALLARGARARVRGTGARRLHPAAGALGGRDHGARALLARSRAVGRSLVRRRRVRRTARERAGV